MNKYGSTLSGNVISFVSLSMMGYFKGPVLWVDSLLCLRMSAVEVNALLDEWQTYNMLMSLHRHCAGYFKVDGLSLQYSKQLARAIHKTRLSPFSFITLPKTVCEWICRLSTMFNAQVMSTHNFMYSNRKHVREKKLFHVTFEQMGKLYLSFKALGIAHTLFKWQISVTIVLIIYVKQWTKCSQICLTVQWIQRWMLYF